jgi:hypothetical protein
MAEEPFRKLIVAVAELSSLVSYSAHKHMVVESAVS